MDDLLKKVDLFYSLATVSDRKSFFNKAIISSDLPGIPSSLVKTIKITASELESHLDSSLTTELNALKNVSVGNDFFSIKQDVQTIAAVTAGQKGPAYTTAVTLLTEINKCFREASKRK